MSVVITGSDLTIADVVSVARHDATTVIAPAAATRMAEPAIAVVGELSLAPGEALALLDNNAFSAGWAALALADAIRLVDTMEAVGALSLEGFGANLSMLHPEIASARPYPGLARSRE